MHYSGQLSAVDNPLLLLMDWVSLSEDNHNNRTVGCVYFRGYGYIWGYCLHLRYALFVITYCKERCPI